MRDEEKSQLALLRKLKEYDDCTTIQIAVASNSQSIMAHQSFQNILNKIWLNKLKHDFSFINLSISILCPLLAPMLLNFQKFHINSNKEIPEVKYDEFEFVYNKQNSNLVERDAFYLEKLYFFITTTLVKFIYYQVIFLFFVKINI